jgi:hypothetical protein
LACALVPEQDYRSILGSGEQLFCHRFVSEFHVVDLQTRKCTEHESKIRPWSNHQIKITDYEVANSPRNQLCARMAEQEYPPSSSGRQLVGPILCCLKPGSGVTVEFS